MENEAGQEETTGDDATGSALLVVPIAAFGWPMPLNNL